MVSLCISDWLRTSDHYTSALQILVLGYYSSVPPASQLEVICAMSGSVSRHRSEGIGYKRRFTFICGVCVCVYLYMHIGVLEGHKRAFDSLELELFADVSCLM